MFRTVQTDDASRLRRVYVTAIIAAEVRVFLLQPNAFGSLVSTYRTLFRRRGWLGKSNGFRATSGRWPEATNPMFAGRLSRTKAENRFGAFYGVKPRALERITNTANVTRTCGTETAATVCRRYFVRVTAEKYGLRRRLFRSPTLVPVRAWIYYQVRLRPVSSERNLSRPVHGPYNTRPARKRTRVCVCFSNFSPPIVAPTASAVSSI